MGRFSLSSTFKGISFFTAIFLLGLSSSFSQNSFTLSGTILDPANSGLENCNLRLKNLDEQTTSTANGGFTFQGTTSISKWFPSAVKFKLKSDRITFTTGSKQPVRVSAFDFTGRRVLNKEWISKSGENQFVFGNNQRLSENKGLLVFKIKVGYYKRNFKLPNIKGVTLVQEEATAPLNKKSNSEVNRFGDTLIVECAARPIEKIFVPDVNTNLGNIQVKNKYNILYIMSDDHTFQAVGVYGSRLAALNPTPTLDKLANEGIRFNNVYVNNSICTPSRASIMTGQYSQTNGVLDLGGNLPPDKQYLPIEMRKAGYTTAMIGKWHLKQEPASYDYYYVLPGQGNYFNPSFRIQGNNNWPNNTANHTGHSSDIITDLSLDWLDTKRDKSKPFFLMHHYKAPHDYFENAQRYEPYLQNVNIPEPENMWWENQPNFGSEATRGINDSLKHLIGTSISPRNPRRNYSTRWGADGVNFIDSTKKAYQTYLKKYLRCVKGIDDNLKRLFEYMETNNLMDNTIIIYTGDQGFMLGEHDYMDKRWMYEESFRMPLLIRYPNFIESGRTSNHLISNVDFAPTMIELAGGTVPNYMQGHSFSDILKGREPQDWRKEVYYRYWMHMSHHDNPGHFGIRTNQYKLIFYYGRDYNNNNNRTPPAWELYDVIKDPDENENIYGKVGMEVVQADLKARLKKLREDINETDAAYPAIQTIIDNHWDD